MAENNISNMDKSQMIESFQQRLLGDYGYQDEQIGKNVEISHDFSVDLAIWKMGTIRKIIVSLISV